MSQLVVNLPAQKVWVRRVNKYKEFYSILIWRKMANQPVPDQSEEFKKSGMVLITDPKSDYYLKKSVEQKKDKKK